ncbi:MAG: MarR family transcriptional regulator [Alphaproteobacteria bacterium]|nr:MarR family transcriptional regulator [Alphaproteobacteria bacterium]
MSSSDDASDLELPSRAEVLICFALYSANHAMNRSYQPHLSVLGLTYPQYIALVGLWEGDGITVGQLCKRLFAETSTLTPVLKRLEKLGHVERRRGRQDERQVFLYLTPSGRALEKEAPNITDCIIADTGVQLDKLSDLVVAIGAMRDSLLKNRNSRE